MASFCFAQKSGGSAFPDSMVFVDDRDGNKYPFVQIGSQFWFVKNLKYVINGSYCLDDKEANCKKYGRLYRWSAALVLSSDMDESRYWKSSSNATRAGVCPQGWHVPSQKDWKKLVDYLSSKHGEENIDLLLKSQKGWANEGGRNSYGFSAVGAGMRDERGSYDGEGVDGYFWSTEEVGLRGLDAVVMRLSANEIGMFAENMSKKAAFSVRCVEDESRSLARVQKNVDSVSWRPKNVFVPPSQENLKKTSAPTPAPAPVVAPPASVPAADDGVQWTPTNNW